MKKDDIKTELEKINEYLGNCLWMDFEFCQMNSSQVVMGGTVDHRLFTIRTRIKSVQVIL
jgi:hypothetical protein